MSNQTLKIKSRHSTVKSAVEAAQLDLSYNKQAAAERIADLDRGGNRGVVSEVFVTEENEVFFIYNCDIRIFQKFEPFHSMLHDSPFQLVIIGDGEITIHTGLKFGRDKESRRVIAKSAIVVM